MYLVSNVKFLVGKKKATDHLLLFRAGGKRTTPYPFGWITKGTAKITLFRESW